MSLPWLAALCFGRAFGAESSPRATAPSYTSASIVNSATNLAGSLAPNAIATIYGTDLSYNTAFGPGGVKSGDMPVNLGGASVFVAGMAAPLYYVSPKQINLVIPSWLYPGDVDLYVSRDGTQGPHVKIHVNDSCPGFFEWEPGMIASTDARGAVITKEHPAQAGEVVVLYGTGLGRTNPPAVSDQIDMTAAPIADPSQLRVLVAGTAVPAASVYYAGLTPGIPGLYQVNVKLPSSSPQNPEVRVAIGGQTSPAGMRLPLH
ncbi:MAG TPA: hypothetical protein VJN43_18380 [Bryobacteraceae bacterium]|nr:hypothetical protein [Bryobacteraceae bacterium]